MTNIKTALQKTKDASYALQQLDDADVVAVLKDFAETLLGHEKDILAANAMDLAKMSPEDPLYDRLLLNRARIMAIADDVMHVAHMESPVGEVIDQRRQANGLDIARLRVPLGVVAVIYEARPNVTMDVFSLCLRTKNACVLRGGTAADETNRVTVGLIHACLSRHGVPMEAVYLMPPAREHMPILLQAHGVVDVCIPRGSQSLIDYVRETASIPVIETGRGVVHIYVDDSADAWMAQEIILNAKTRRVSVCNALDTLLVHESRIGDLEKFLGGMAEKGVHVFVDDRCHEVLQTFYPAEQLEPLAAGGLDTEFLSLKMNVAVVEDVDAAIRHIRAHGSGHTDTIISGTPAHVERFLEMVDSAVVMVNASTGFSDGGQFGLGAEIGISTQKLHARGPMGLEPLTAYKWVVRGTGQVRE